MKDAFFKRSVQDFPFSKLFFLLKTEEEKQKSRRLAKGTTLLTSQSPLFRFDCVGFFRFDRSSLVNRLAHQSS